jgi:hypothetical protein
MKYQLPLSSYFLAKYSGLISYGRVFTIVPPFRLDRTYFRALGFEWHYISSFL